MRTRFSHGLLFLLTTIFWVSSASSQTAIPEVSQLRLERDGDAVVLSAAVRFELSAAVEDALHKGIALYFLAEADVLRDRWYWSNKKITTTQRQARLAYNPLTRRWRLSFATGAASGLTTGVALSQGFDSLPDALAAVQRLSRWKVAEIAEIDPEHDYFLEFRFRLDTTQLPRPFQIGTVGQSDWVVAVTANQKFQRESLR